MAQLCASLSGLSPRWLLQLLLGAKERPKTLRIILSADASLAQLAEHALRKRMVVGSIPTGGFIAVSRGLVN